MGSHEPDGADEPWYFAYGANMSLAVLARRGIEPLESEPGVLAGHRLVFDMPGLRLLEPAFASIEPAPGAHVHGLLHRLRPGDPQRLDAFEVGVQTGYRPVVLEVRGRGGTRRARTYVAVAPRKGLRPSRRYVRLLAGAAREAGLPPDYVRGIERQPSAYVPILSELAGLSIALTDRFNAWLDEDDDEARTRR